MLRVLSILSGAGFTVLFCWACGALLLRRLRLGFDPLERVLFSFLCGSACASILVFLLCLMHAARAGIFLAGGAGLIGWAALHRGQGPLRKALPSLSKPWICLLGFSLAAYSLLYFLHALAPEVSPDGSGYHLGNVARILGSHGFAWDYRSMYSAFPQGMEMLFLVAFAFGEHPAAALVHFAFLAALPLMLLCYGRRFGLPYAAAFAAIVVFASPLFGVVGTSAYNDVALAACSFAVFYLFQVWAEERSFQLLIAAGLLAGFCLGLKDTGVLALVLAAAWCSRAPDMRQRLRQWSATLVPAALVALPWMLRNWFWLGNPLAPFFNRWFPNPFFSAAAERDYLADVGHLEGLRHWWELPLDMTLYGAMTPGLLGPVFLLAPLALLALRERRGRSLLAAAALFSIPVALTPATRFLMAGMPFLCVALGMALRNSRGVLPALAAFQALLCWPALVPLYAAPWSWRIRAVPVRAAFRLEPESAYIERHLADYKLKAGIEDLVPESQKIFSFRTRPEAYFSRTILVGYESAAGLEIQKILVDAIAHPELRRGAMAELKRRKIGFLLASPGDPGAGEFSRDMASWGITRLREADGTSLYRIE